MASVTVINDDLHFQTELSSAGIKLVVVDFTATWCGPCQRIAPFFEQLPAKYPRAVFLKVDVDKCQETAAAQGVSAMPTFIFYRNKAKIDRLQGADIQVRHNSLFGIVRNVHRVPPIYRDSSTRSGNTWEVPRMETREQTPRNTARD